MRPKTLGEMSENVTMLYFLRYENGMRLVVHSTQKGAGSKSYEIYIYKLVGLLLSHSLTVSSSFICSFTNAACVRVLSNVCARHVLYWDIVVHDIPCNGFTTAK